MTDPLPDGSATYRIVYSLEPTQAVSAIYVLKGQASVVVDAKTLLPVEYEERIVAGLAITGAEEKHKKLVYDQAAHEIHYYAPRDGRPELEFRRTRSIPPDAQHFLSLLYYIRFAKMAPGGVVAAVISDRKKDLTVTASVLREEPYISPGGENRTALVLQTTTDFGKDEIKDSGFLIWLDKAERFPVRLDAKFKWGTITAKLVKRRIGPEP